MTRPWLTYAIAPPNQATPLERQRAIAAEHSARLAALPIDALLVYDVQDEVTRTARPRPFAFQPKVDPLTFAYEALEVGALPRIVYRAVADMDQRTLRSWLDRLHALGGRAVLVGAPSRRASSTLTLSEAFSLCRAYAPEVPFGGVVIPERHGAGGGEDARLWAKMQQGCRFFFSQTVWSVATTKQLLGDLASRAEREGITAPPISLTFSPCGSAQTLEFLQWLGVAISEPVRRELLGARDMLVRSIDLALDACAEVLAFASERGLTIGCNVESLTARPAETEASMELLRRIARLDSPRSGAWLHSGHEERFRSVGRSSRRAFSGVLQAEAALFDAALGAGERDHAHGRAGFGGPCGPQSE